MSDLYKDLIVDIKKLIRSYNKTIYELKLSIDKSNINIRELKSLDPPVSYPALASAFNQRDIDIREKRAFESVLFDLSNLDAILHDDND